LTLRDEYGSEDVNVVVRAIEACDGGGHGALAPRVDRSDRAPFVRDAVPMPEWDTGRFDRVWVLTLNAGGWTLRQRPQLLLPSDRGGQMRQTYRGRPRPLKSSGPSLFLG